MQNKHDCEKCGVKDTAVTYVKQFDALEERELNSIKDARLCTSCCELYLRGTSNLTRFLTLNEDDKEL